MNQTVCPSCGHADAHTPLIGCLHSAGNTFCPCEAAWTPPKTIRQAHAERDEAMARAEQGTDPAWAEQAERAVRDLAAVTAFTPDDVWDRLHHLGVQPPREPRALGPILKRLAKDKVIRPGGFTESRRRHGAPVRIYTGCDL